MNRTVLARSLRYLLLACFVAVVFPLVIGLVGRLMDPPQAAVLLPFASAALAVACLGPVLTRVDRLVQRLAHDSTTTPYSALAEASARIGAGSLDEALPGLARVLGEGTGAGHAAIWLAVGDKLVVAASYPAPNPAVEPRAVDNLAVLLAEPETDQAVPVLEGPKLRAVLVITKPGRPITPADQRLMQDVANGAGVLLRGVALNAALAERVRRADELAAELAASRWRLHQARDVERRRLVSELGSATTDRLTNLRTDLAEARDALTETSEQAGEEAKGAIGRATTDLDELLDRFRQIARGVYPAVLRDQGPFGALEEVIADLPRPVELTGELADRLVWEVESGIYYLTASAIRQLAERPGARPLKVYLRHTEGNLMVTITDPDPPATLDELRAWLAVDSERLAALGGALELTVDGESSVVLHAWLPDQLAPSVVVPAAAR
ncbi:hypothetical protein GCM10023321_16610 [Pseudonocardia eucalypti]|uniref:Uncharacterized protein n=1 Tax=Pseudonocardia eucalypti TaxID=648755 RepID=A0ABP9PQX7_9PSEU|nr:signal transduction histidine kinase [Pseudonocardia eucalypti]